MIRFVLIISVLSLSSVRPNDVENLAVKVLRCQRLCRSLSPSTPRGGVDEGGISPEKSKNEIVDTCLARCNATYACLGPSCSLFCDRDDDVCRGVCKIMAEEEADRGSPDPCISRTCPEEEGQKSGITITTSNTSSTSTFVSYSFNGTAGGEGYDSLVLLDQQVDSSTSATFLTLDFRLGHSGGTFEGVVPWRNHRFRVVRLYSNDTCCYDNAMVAITLEVDIDNINPNASFYPYAMPFTWIRAEPETGVKFDKSVSLYPETLYVSQEDGIQDYNLAADFNKANITLSRPILGVKYYNGNNPPSRLSSGFVVTLGNTTRPSYDTNLNPGPYFNFKSRTFCKFLSFPLNHTAPRLNFTCRRAINNTAVTLEPALPPALRVFECGRSGGGGTGREITQSCCGDGTQSCVLRDGSGLLVLNPQLDYLLYLVNDTGSQCYVENPCPGVYQRVNTDEIPICNDPVDPTTPAPRQPDKPWDLIVGLTSAGVIVGVFLAMLGIWYLKLAERNAPKKAPQVTPSFGGELPRDSIVKELFIAKGGHGFIFKGKLHIKENRSSDEPELGMSQLFDVAIKILKTKLDDTVDEGERDDVREAKKAMRAEINVMRRLQDTTSLHRHVLMMYGYVIDASPYILVLDLCITDVKRYLKSLRIQINSLQLTSDELQDELAFEIKPRGSPSPVHRPEGLSRGLPVYQRSTTTNTTYQDSEKGNMSKHTANLDSLKHVVLQTSHLHNYCWQVASGMDYVHSLDVLHCDLAADNVLVKVVDDEVTLKICDFGQSRILYKGEYVSSGDNIADRQRKFRLRWTAPEVQRKEGTNIWGRHCDIWSYGVFMWEVFTLGGFPYSGWPDYVVRDNLEEGYRMKKPQACPEEVWKVMSRCWTASASDRGTFSGIKDRLEHIAVEAQDAERGIVPNDYITCDEGPPCETEADLSPTTLDVDIQDVDVEEGRLSIEGEKDEDPLGDHLRDQSVIEVNANDVQVEVRAVGSGHAPEEEERAEIGDDNDSFTVGLDGKICMNTLAFD